MRPPFDMLRACFLLLAFIVVTEMVASVLGGIGCAYFNFISNDPHPGACAAVTDQIRQQWSDLLAAILALLLAARKPPDHKE